MSKDIIYETNSGLGYNQTAFGIIVNEGFFIIGKDGNFDDYPIGTVEEISDTLILQKSDYSLEQSPLYNSFLFQILLAVREQEEFKLIEQLKNINNDEANDFLKHFKRGAEAIVEMARDKESLEAGDEYE